MGMPADRLRWFRPDSRRQLRTPGSPQSRRQPPHLSTTGDTTRWRLEPGFFVEGVRQCCPGTLLRSLQVGDRLELAPEDIAPGLAVRVEFGIFQVGYAPASASRLLHRLLRQGIGISAQVGKLDLKAPLERALWIEACLLE